MGSNTCPKQENRDRLLLCNSINGGTLLCVLCHKTSAEGDFPLVYYMKKLMLLKKSLEVISKRRKTDEIETLTSRLMIDLKTLFPDFTDEVQVTGMLLSLDKDNPPDVVALWLLQLLCP